MKLQQVKDSLDPDTRFHIQTQILKDANFHTSLCLNHCFFLANRSCGISYENLDAMLCIFTHIFERMQTCRIRLTPHACVFMKTLCDVAKKNCASHYPASFVKWLLIKEIQDSLYMHIRSRHNYHFHDGYSHDFVLKTCIKKNELEKK